MDACEWVCVCLCVCVCVCPWNIFAIAFVEGMEVHSTQATERKV